MTLETATPKPQRTPGVLRRMERRTTRRAALERASAKKRRTSYGGGDWRAFRREILQRDSYRCCVCGQPGTDVHHLVGVGAGGKNQPDNALVLCRLDHARVHDGHIAKQTLHDLLAERYAYDYTGGSSK